jgi:uncharacterized protein (TIGR00251 family)
MAPFLKVTAKGVMVSLKVQPRASKNEICGALGNDLKVKIAAPPVGSAANEELVRFLSEVLDVAKREVTLVRGASSRQKTICITGLSAVEVEERLRVR